VSLVGSRAMWEAITAEDRLRKSAELSQYQRPVSSRLLAGGACPGRVSAAAGPVHIRFRRLRRRSSHFWGSWRTSLSSRATT